MTSDNMIRKRDGAERYNNILTALDKSGVVRVTDLSKTLKVSEVTIRKDLKYLESLGKLVRTHGGAVVPDNTPAYSITNDWVSEKKRVAAAAAELVSDGDFIFINTGSTCVHVSEALKGKRNLTILTNSVLILNTLLGTPGFTIIFLGGIVNNDMQITTGDDVVEQISRYTADKMFLGMDGIDIEQGATTYNHVEEAIIRLMIQRSRERVLVVDGSKIGKVTFAHVADLTDFDTIVTNRTEHNSNILDQMTEMGVRIIDA